jgi:hypothetical protein
MIRHIINQLFVTAIIFHSSILNQIMYVINKILFQEAGEFALPVVLLRCPWRTTPKFRRSERAPDDKVARDDGK